MKYKNNLLKVLQFEIRLKEWQFMELFQKLKEKQEFHEKQEIQIEELKNRQKFWKKFRQKDPLRSLCLEDQEKLICQLIQENKQNLALIKGQIEELVLALQQVKNEEKILKRVLEHYERKNIKKVP